jgi:hypothetical protein
VIFVVASGNEGPTYQVTAQPEPFSAPYFDVAALITPEISKFCCFLVFFVLMCLQKKKKKKAWQDMESCPNRH